MPKASLGKRLKTTKSAYERMIEMQVRDMYAMPTDDDAPFVPSAAPSWIELFGKR